MLTTKNYGKAALTHAFVLLVLPPDVKKPEGRPRFMKFSFSLLDDQYPQIDRYYQSIL